MDTRNLRKSPGRNMKRISLLIAPVLLAAGFLAACTLKPIPSVPTMLPTTTQILPPSPTATQTMPATPTMTASPTLTASPTASFTPTLTPTHTPEPTYVVLRGVVNEEHVMCFYGPSKAYLYKYGLLGGNRLEIIGILRDTGYIEIRAIGGSNPCWMNMQFMDVQGDVNLIQPIDPLDVVLPWSPYYNALDSVNATRQGDLVTISWSPLNLRAGDDSEQEPYLVETWVCQNDVLVFIPFGVYETEVSVVDEPGCTQPSHGRVYGVEKHGYTLYLQIPWPLASE